MDQPLLQRNRAFAGTGKSGGMVGGGCRPVPEGTVRAGLEIFLESSNRFAVAAAICCIHARKECIHA